MRPFWKEAVNSHAVVGQSDAWDRIKFARLFDRGEGSLSEYVRLSFRPGGLLPGWGFYSFDVWENLGTGGTKMKADGNRYCDLEGTGR